MELLTTPRCEATGLPLLVSPFVPREPGARYKQGSNYHHANSPKTAMELQEIAGKARRYSWGQMLNITVHDRYTHRFAGPNLEMSDNDEFKEIVLALSGVRPRQVLAVETDQNRVVELDNQEYTAMYQPLLVHHQDAYHASHKRRSYARTVLGRYLAEYALSRDMVQTFKEETIEQFLDPQTNAQRRFELGNQFIIGAIGSSIDTLIPEHQSLVQEGYAVPGRHMAVRTAVGKFFTKQYFEDYHQTVSDRLKLAVA